MLRGGDDPRLLLAGRLDLDDAGDADPRVLGADDVAAGRSPAARPARGRSTCAPLTSPRASRSIRSPAVLERQLDAVADQRLARQQRVRRRAVGGAEGVDQPHPRRVAPDQHRRPRHRAGVDPRARPPPGRRAPPPRSTIASKSSKPSAGSPSAWARSRIGLSAACRCTRAEASASPRPAARRTPCRRPPPTGASCAGSPNSTSVANSCAQVGVLPLVEHRRLVDQPDVERLVAPLPALDEVRAAQPGARQRPGDRAVLAVEGQRPVERRLAQVLDLRAARPCRSATRRSPRSRGGRAGV